MNATSMSIVNVRCARFSTIPNRWHDEMPSFYRESKGSS